ncbi:MAG: hypothetical protein K9H64_03780 [Bacteroidales bacterium]|nr:hypothetical protein [Bacteroidales bacterium]MCF8454953.1 hypothetical protein [Bacteroidales bacterium]
MKIQLIKEDNIEVNLNGIKDYLNSKVKFYDFQVGESIEIIDTVISYPETHKSIFSLINNHDDFDYNFIFTDKPYDNNFFFEGYSNIIPFSFYQWDALTNLSKNNGVLHFIAVHISLDLDDEFRHDSTTGCIYDFLWNKAGIDDCMRQARVCQPCLARISESIDDSGKQILNDLKVILNDLSCASKWNQDLLEYLKTENVITKQKEFQKRKSLKRGEINVLLASPSDTEIERNKLIHNLERKFRTENYEKLCNHRLILNIWEDVASQNGYAQDIINDEILHHVDIVLAVFKHKLGTPTTDTSGAERAPSGSAEELLYAIDNHDNSKNPIGMAYFYSKAPSPSFDLPDFQKILSEWNRLEKFKTDIRTKILYKPYSDSEELLDLTCRDLSNIILSKFEKY